MRILIIVTLMTICLTAIGQTTIDTESKYTPSDIKGVIIQNSFPKGGLKYTDHKGKVYVYAVFWTRLLNETDNPFTLTIDFPADSLELASSAGRYFKLLIPSDTMTLEKEKLFNYGLSDLESFLNKNLGKASIVNRTINPKESNGFYVVTLFNRGVDGTLRTGLSLKGKIFFIELTIRKFIAERLILKISSLISRGTIFGILTVRRFSFNNCRTE